ncbi:Transcriptional coactivator p15 (PC4) family protein (KELP) [Hibiscus syriacus]|uniref:Transcriptional coactivator p15 (PC4) family protein (KELP) n=1 Tax=Hibiscus syriacus TaxID=106335 RepID=A0A6A3CF21_HIBSY|nr:uncharacterized protein LOC120199718 [Hibiscus syriacus]KAE8727316.1 Transcriptional coactivator p15 (PC4) family protein (KELP) [Hibiscus syriacus]
MTMALLSGPPPPPPPSHKTFLFQRPYSTCFRSITCIKYPFRPTVPFSSTASSSTAEDEPSASPDGVAATAVAVEDPSFRGCKACGKEELEWGCDGEGRIQGGIATVPGFGWWPIKAYRPCPAFVASGGRYTRRGQSMDDVASGGRGRVSPVGNGDEAELSKGNQGPRKFKS